MFATSTIPHDQGDGLVPLFDGVTKAWADVRADVSVRQWFGDHHVDWVRATEVTHGANGWHPHLHTALITERPLERSEAQELRSIMYEPWCRSAERSGWRRPSEKYGLSVIRCSSGQIGEYVSKVEGLADELTRLDVKRSSNKTDPPFTILNRAVGGDQKASAIWHEYERGTKGRRALMPSQRFRVRLQLGVEQPDSELSDPSEPTWRLFGELNVGESEMLVMHPQGFEVFAEAVGPGTPEAWNAALATLRGTMPWWLTEHGWWIRRPDRKATEEELVRSDSALALSFNDLVDVDF